MILILPWPPKECSPNFKRKHHWRKYYKQVKAYRKTCLALALNKKPPSFNMKVTFNPPDNRRRDNDNTEGSFKSGRDGLADAWGVDDNIFRVSYDHSKPVEGGRVTVEFIV